MFKALHEPFRQEKIPLDTVETDELVEDPSEQKKKTKPRNGLKTLKRLWTYLAYQKGLLFLVFLMIVASAVFSLLGPFLVGVAIDTYIVTQDATHFIYLLLGLAGVYVFHSLSVWLQNHWMIGISQRTVYRLRSHLFQHLHKLPIRYFDQHQHGELMSRITNDIENISQTLNRSVIQVFTSVLTLTGMLIVMVWLSPLLTVITLTVVPLMVMGMKWITKRTRILFKEQQKRLGELNGLIEETITGQKVVKSYSQEQKVMADFVTKSERLKTAGFWAQTYSGFIPKLMNMLNNLSFAIIAGVGGLLALFQLVSIGMIVIFAEYSRQLTRPVNELANQFNQLLAAIAGAERVFAVLDEAEEEQEEEGGIELTDVQGEVQFIDVHFAYEKDEVTLRNIHLHASPGETVAFVGPTGAGKTTMINLLSRFYDVDQGYILLDGYDLSTIKREHLRQYLGFVLQDTFLFQGTIRENIRYGRLEATDAEVEEAAKLANAHSFITKLSAGYDTLLDQDGSGISQGQKQLLSIARALLANPSILILDEATSSIDTVTEMKIQEALQRLMKGRTSFVIAHRLNTIQHADQILMLQDGQIIEQGSHEDLLRQRGSYYDLYQSQFHQHVV